MAAIQKWHKKYFWKSNLTFILSYQMKYPNMKWMCQILFKLWYRQKFKSLFSQQKWPSFGNDISDFLENRTWPLFCHIKQYIKIWNGCVRYFSSYCMDKFGSRQMNSNFLAKQWIWNSLTCFTDLVQIVNKQETRRLLLKFLKNQQLRIITPERHCMIILNQTEQGQILSLWTFLSLKRKQILSFWIFCPSDFLLSLNGFQDTCHICPNIS